MSKEKHGARPWVGASDRVVKGGFERGLSSSPTAREALGIGPVEPTPRSGLLGGLGDQVRIGYVPRKKRVKRTRQPEVAFGPPWITGFLLYDGRHPALAEYFRYNRRMLGQAAGSEILLVGIGHPSHVDEVFRELAPDEVVRDFEGRFTEIYDKLVQKLDGRTDVGIDGTEELAQILGVKRDQLPSLHFVSYPRSDEDVNIRIPPSLVDSAAKLRLVTDVLLPAFEQICRDSPFRDGVSNKQVMEAFRPSALSIERELQRLAPSDVPTTRDGWQRFPAIGDVQYHERNQLLVVDGREYRLQTEGRARVVEVLLAASQSGNGAVKHQQLMQEADLRFEKIQDVFKGHPLMKDGVLRARTRGYWSICV